MKLKEDNPGVLLMVEVGYKLKFFDEDAKVSCHASPASYRYVELSLQVASTELGIACFPHRNFMEAMIPVHRRDVHLKKYVLSNPYMFFCSLHEDYYQKAIKLA